MNKNAPAPKTSRSWCSLRISVLYWSKTFCLRSIKYKQNSSRLWSAHWFLNHDKSLPLGGQNERKKSLTGIRRLTRTRKKSTGNDVLFCISCAFICLFQRSNQTTKGRMKRQRWEITQEIFSKEMVQNWNLEHNGLYPDYCHLHYFLLLKLLWFKK